MMTVSVRSSQRRHIALFVICNEEQKMKHIIVIVCFLITSCTNNNKTGYAFEPIVCNPEETPKYDEKRIPILDKYGNLIYDKVKGGVVIRDSLGKRIIKKRSIFKPCREMIYNAEFKTNENKLISKGKIKVMASGTRWKYQPEKQDEIIVQYEFTQSD